MRRIALLLAVFPLIVPVVAEAGRAPRTASIKVGKSMAGADLGQRNTFSSSGLAVRGDPFEDWGRFRFGACVELACAWKIQGGGNVTTQFSGAAGSIFVANIRTTGPRWNTERRIHPGSTAAAVESAYDSRQRRIFTCAVGDFGAPHYGYRVNSHASSTFFELYGPNGTKIRAIWITDRKISATDPACG